MLSLVDFFSFFTANRPQDSSYPVPLNEMEEEGVWGDLHEVVQSVLDGKGALFRAKGVSFVYSTLLVDNGVHYRVYVSGNVFEIVSAPDTDLQSFVASIVDEHSQKT